MCYLCGCLVIVNIVHNLFVLIAREFVSCSSIGFSVVYQRLMSIRYYVCFWYDRHGSGAPDSFIGTSFSFHNFESFKPYHGAPKQIEVSLNNMYIIHHYICDRNVCR